MTGSGSDSLLAPPCYPLLLGWGLVAAAGWCAAAPAAGAHDWYVSLTSPAGERCCFARDCQGVALRRDAVGGIEVAIEGRWVPVDASALLAAPTPDGGAHACYRRLLVFGVEILRIRCVILPEGS